MMHILHHIKAAGQLSKERFQRRTLFWKHLFTATILAVFLYVMMEWIFFVTMPSFMSIIAIPGKVRIFFISGLGFSLFWAAVLAGFVALDSIALFARASKISAFAGVAIPTIILSALVLLLFDNFTYTVFKFGISTSTGIARGTCGVLFAAITVCIYSLILKSFGLVGGPAPKERIVNRLSFIAIGILVISAGLAFSKLKVNSLDAANASTAGWAGNLPNIILLGSDGLNAENLSPYGYYRNTTPQLAKLAESSLVAENAFTNAGNTAGSVISIMTSKLPTQTRVLYPPNILTGNDSFQHLPGILKNQGYKTVEYGVPYYIDAYNYNLQNGFDVVNNRTLNVGELGELGRKLGYEDEVYFLSRIIWRISDRLLHIYFIRTMQNPFDIVIQAVPNISDADKIQQMLDIIDQADVPIFIHVHLLGTHGGFYNPPDQLYSAGKNQFKPWMVDFYDDTLRAFDTFVGEVVSHLKKSGDFENTILIVYTDHNKEFKVNERVPLIIHFPHGEYAGRINGSAENLDIAPTILAYLGLSQPPWMGGESLIKGNLPSQRLIFSAGTSETKPNENKIAFLDPDLDKPPFYQFSYIDVIDCQNWYSFDLYTFAWTSGKVKGYVNPCKTEDLLSSNQIKQAIYYRLVSDGFDISLLP